VHTADFFNYDDPEFVAQNSLVVEGLKANHLYQVWTSFLMGLWAPVTWTSYLLDVELFGMNPGPMHVVNVVWHTIRVLLLFFILHRSTGALWRSALVTALTGIQLILGRALQGSGQIDAAIILYKDVLERTPYDPQAHYLAGTAYETLEAYDKALTNYTESARLDSKYPPPERPIDRAFTARRIRIMRRTQCINPIPAQPLRLF